MMQDGIAFVLTSSKERGGFATPIRHLTANALSVELPVRSELSANRTKACAGPFVPAILRIARIPPGAGRPELLSARTSQQDRNWLQHGTTTPLSPVSRRPPRDPVSCEFT